MTQGRKEDGGPAFPTHEERDCHDHTKHIYHTGMSLRDWYAGMALQGMLTRTGVSLSEMLNDDPSVADVAYLVADKMIKARSA